MANEVYIKGQRIRLEPSQSKGKGGEADIFDIGQFYKDGRTIVAKVFKTADHPDYRYPDGSPIIHEQKGATARLALHQTKLREFPAGLPPQVVTPIDLITDRTGKTVKGYTMEFIGGYNLLSKYRMQDYRESGGIGNDLICQLFIDLHAAVSGCHPHAVLGDFNELNILVAPTHNKVKLIDADSIQFGKYLCRTFMQTFVDPMLCVPNPDPKVSGAILQGIHNPDSDWYAYAVMLMQCLLFLDGGPYGGVYNPKDKTKRLNACDRWEKRITVFHPEVRYPKPSIPLRVLPDDVLHLFEQMFAKDKRDEFPVKYLNMTWTQCNCGAVHARRSCPICQMAAPTQPTETTVIHGKVKATTVFNKQGVTILHATSQNNEIKYVFHDGQSYRRETNEVVINGKLDANMRIRICGQETIIGKKGQIVTLKGGQVLSRNNVDSYGVLPLLDTNSLHRYWIENGVLNRNMVLMGTQGSDTVGEVLANQTLFWIGNKFGFGFYRAGEISIAFVFDANGVGINDNVQLSIKGQLIDANCVFSDHFGWLFLSLRQGSKIINECHVISANGLVQASMSVEKGSDPWLDTLRGKLAVGKSLFVPTDEGLHVYEAKGKLIEKVREYPDTEQFLDAGSLLLPGKQGIYVVSSNEIKLLQLS